ncbi:MAG TPA: gliding motility-associated C-terminal domain-containing protein [Puia sp.]|nr:gliding motility-associated C-terminal domain-containing protein [Puia sp.]
MRINKLLFTTVLFAGMLAMAEGVAAQSCTVAGQTPGTAFPVCGTTVFKQDNVPLCGGNKIFVPCPDTVQNLYTDINPFYYKFTCFSSGTLGFLITPNTTSDDYDWQLFDVTGHSPYDIFTDRSLYVSGNWSSNPGATGAVSSATGSVNCAGPAYSNKNGLPTIIKGHNYLLLVSHFTQTQSGYSLSFAGGTASITDPTPPALQSARAICDGSRIEIALNKPMQCASLAADGSDFVLSPAPAGLKVVGAFAVNCAGFDLDTLVVVVNGPLSPGNYSLTMATGTDGNTLVDNCGAAVPVGQNIPFTMVAPKPTPLDSIAPVGCAPTVLQLVFPDKISCSTIAADGSDFTVTGPAPVTVVGAYGQCDTGNMTYRVFVKLSAPILKGGTFRINLDAGTDGNTLINECGLTSPPGSLPFSTGDTVSAALFTDQLLLGCRADTIVYQYPSVNGVNQWQWIFDGGDTSLQQDPPPRIYSVFGTKNVRLTVSNGFCSDTASLALQLGNAISAGLEVPNILCPKDYASYLDKSTGDLHSWTWDFGDGTSFSGESPPQHLYPLTGIETKYTVTLVVGNGVGCYDTAAQQIDVLRSCYIAVPGAFTPNGDGLNDYLYPLNAYKADNLNFKVFNRFGQMVFEAHEWTQKWDGTLHGHAEPAGTYVWMLEYTDHDTGKHVFQKGTTILIR